MTLERFIQQVRAGKVQHGVAGRGRASLASGVATLPATDVDAITAEAYNQGVVDSSVPWVRTRARVVKLLDDKGAST